MFLSTTDNLIRAMNIACRLHHNGHEDIVITVIDLEAADLDVHNVTHAEAISKIAGLARTQQIPHGMAIPWPH